MTKQQKINHPKYNQYMMVLEEFKPCKKPNSEDYYEVYNYYGVSYYKRKKDNKHMVSLIYEYSSTKNQLKSSYIELDTLHEAIEVILIMDEFAEDKSISKRAKFDFNNIKDYKSESITTDAIATKPRLNPFG